MKVIAKDKDNGVAEVAREALEGLLDRMGLSASITSRGGAAADDSEDPLTLDIQGEDLGILIGRRGQTLASLQYIVRLIVGYRTDEWLPIIIDVEGYKERRYERLKALAWRLAERVKVRKSPFTMEPMLAYERRIIHLALSEHPEITTESIGEGVSRRVVIKPR